jgi:hypothetical protein
VQPGIERGRIDLQDSESADDQGYDQKRPIEPP